MGTVLIVLFGIILPAVTLAVELATGMCAEAFLDPIPTVGHVILVALVPLVNLLALLCPMREWTKWRVPLLWANGIVMGITLVYSLVFVVLMPMAAFAIIFFGIGLLPLAPFFSLLCAIVLRRRLANMLVWPVDGEAVKPVASPPASLKSLFGGAILGILLLVALEARTALTLIGAEMAVSESKEQAARGIGLLRLVGSRDALLWMCYQDQGGRGLMNFGRRPHMMTGLLFSGISREAAQQVYFRVTGEPYNSAPPPHGVSRFLLDEFDFDPDLGGEAVAGRRKGLSLSSSRVDAQLHSDAAVGYVEWTMVFKNDHDSQREARAQILLPPGGVVSRVTLWVNGEPREAAFAGSGQVREAYKKVAVQQRRDPLLVTWAGNDRVLVQCFPVPPHGEMKIRLGITAPMTLADLQTASLRFPRFAERNFSVAPGATHSLWIESEAAYRQIPAGLHQETSKDARHVLRGSLVDDEMSSDGITIVTSRSADVVESWTPDLKDPKKFVLQKVSVDPLPAKHRIAVVVDGSRRMAGHFEAIAEALAAVDPSVKLDVFVAGDEAVAVSDAVRSDKQPNLLAHRFQSLGGKGGCDNVPALLRAFEESEGDRTIVWIHASQPILLQSAMPLIQWLERDRQAVLYDFAIAGGPNRILEQLGSVGSLRSVPRLGNVRDDLRYLLTRLTGQAKDNRLVRVSVEGQPPDKPKASSHLARLWAADQVSMLVHSGKATQRAEAVKLAANYQLVTPVSGAVVLENQQQYDEAKLKSADPDSTPGTPEPAAWIMLLTVLPWLARYVWKRRRQSQLKV